MLSIFDLFDLHAVFVNIRNDPNNTQNQKIVEAVLFSVNDTDCISGNSLRKAIGSACTDLPQEYAFVYAENNYPFIPFLLKNENKRNLLSFCASYLLQVIKEKNAERISDTADAMHNLPMLLLDARDLNFFWRGSIVPYRKKWDRSFFKSIRKKDFL